MLKHARRASRRSVVEVRSPCRRDLGSASTTTVAGAHRRGRRAGLAGMARPRRGRGRHVLDRLAGRRTDHAGRLPSSAARTVEPDELTALRAVIADDSVLLRDGVVRLLGDAGIEVVAAVGDGDALVAAVGEHARTSRWSTCGCRRPTPTRGSAPRSTIRGASRRWRCSCCRSTSRSVRHRLAERGHRRRRLPAQGPRRRRRGLRRLGAPRGRRWQRRRRRGRAPVARPDELGRPNSTG